MNNAISLKEPGWDLPSKQYSSTGIEAESAELDALDNGAELEKDKPEGLLQLFRKYASLSDLLRYAGAVSVAVAMAMFLIDGATDYTYVQRFLTMLGFTALLTIAGFVMSMLLKEQRGSRAFMMLALLSVPVNFTVFGALLYSLMPLDAVTQVVPGFAFWQAGSGEILTSLAAGLAVLVPVVWMSYTVLARTFRRSFSTCLLLSSAVLVVPVRHEIAVAVLAVIAVAGLSLFVKKSCKESLVLKTIEGRFSVALLFLPPVILLARGLFLYQAGSAMVLMLAVGAYVVLRQVLRSLQQASLPGAIGTLALAAVALVLSMSFTDVIRGNLAYGLGVIPGICVYLFLCDDILKVAPNRKLAEVTGLLSVVFAMCALVAIAMSGNTIIVTMVCTAVLSVVAAYGYLKSKRGVTVSALIGIIAISAMYIETLWNATQQTGWWGIAAAGAVAIVAGSLVDRAGTVVVEKPEVA